MNPVTERELRASFVNATLRERNAVTLPTDLDALVWDDLDYLGWRDRRQDKVGYVVVPREGGPVGVLLRVSTARSRFKAQCSWCEDVHLPNDVVFFSAKLAGKAGRTGDTVGTLACEHFECSANVRRRYPAPYDGYDLEAAREERIASLRGRVTAFAERVLAG